MHDLFPFYAIGHFINEPTNPTEFEIIRFGEMAEPEVDDPHKHTFYEIIWVEEGRSRQIIDYKRYEIAPGTLFFISPGQVHEFLEWQHIRGGSIFFTETFYLLNQQPKDKLFELSFLDDFYANPCVVPDSKTFAEIKQTIDLLLIEQKRLDRSTSIQQALLHVVLTQIQRYVDAQGVVSIPKPYLVLYKKFRLLIDANFTEALTVNDYANQLNISQHHLNFITKQITGQTATEVIRARTLLEAKRLLTFTHLPISEIAARLGYFDSSYFARLFRAESGLTPARFRQSMSEKYRKPPDLF